jgi:acyl-CoA thioester hydrolase
MGHAKLLEAIGGRPVQFENSGGMIQSRAEVTVRYAETDMMGVVYHGSYLPWLEVGRTTLLRELGLPYRDLEALGFFLPVLEVSVKYRQPARYDDTIAIITTLREKPLLRIQLDYEVRRGDELLATARTVHAFIDRTGRPVRPPPQAIALFARAFEAAP